MSEDAVRAHLKAREVGPRVAEGGLDYLVENWKAIAEAVESRDEWVWEEWINDLDCREIIEDLLTHVPEANVARTAIKKSDELFLANVVRTNECAWGDDLAVKNGWDPIRNWWYWAEPPTPFVT